MAEQIHWDPERGYFPPFFYTLRSLFLKKKSHHKNLCVRLQEVSCLKYLEVLMLQKNNFSWTIPESIGKLEALVKLDLSENNFRGELPQQTLGTLGSLEYINISNNPRLSGKIPRELRQLRSLTHIDLSGTALEDLDEFASAMAEGNSAAQKSVRVLTEGFSKSL